MPNHRPSRETTLLLHALLRLGETQPEEAAKYFRDLCGTPGNYDPKMHRLVTTHKPPESPQP